MSRVCEEFHLSVRQALTDLNLPDLDLFESSVIAEESAVLMFEVMEVRAFAAARRAYQNAKVEDQPKLAKEDAMVALCQEFEFAQAKERLQARRAAAQMKAV